MQSARAIPEPGFRSVLGSAGFRRPADPLLTSGTGWLPGELLDVTCAAGRGVVVGQCMDQLFAGRVIRALERDELHALMSLHGAYSAILMRPAGAVVLLADVVGQFPLYYGSSGDRTVFGTRASVVAAEIGSLFDTVSLALEIACPQAFSVLGARTPFDGVRQVGPGNAVRIDASGIRAHAVVSLIPRERATANEAAAELRNVLPAAVAARANGPLSADFSGGLDSVSLAFLALREADTLVAVTFAQDGAAVEDDLAAAASLARLDRRIDHRLVRGSESDLPYRHSVAGDLPHPSALHLGAVRARLSTVAEHGVTTHLMGEGGDHVLSAPHAYMADLARSGRFGTLWRHCVAWARLRHRPPMLLLVQAIRLAVMSDGASLARQLRRAPVSRWEETAMTVTGAPSGWLTVRARDALVAQISDDSAAPGHTAGDRAVIAQLRSSARAQQAVRDLAATRGIAVHAPFLDPRVVGVCLAVPPWRKADPQVAKPLLRVALAGLVPDAVFARTTKGDYTSSAHLGVRRAINEIRTLLKEPISADLGLIEPAPVREALDRAANGMPAPWGELNQVLAVETWLHDVTLSRRERASDAGVHRPSGGSHDDRRDRADGGSQRQNRAVARIERDGRPGVPGTGTQR